MMINSYFYVISGMKCTTCQSGVCFFCFFRNFTFLMILNALLVKAQLLYKIERFNLVCDLLWYVLDQFFKIFLFFLVLHLLAFFSRFLDCRVWNTMLFEWSISLFRCILFLAVKHFHCSVNCSYVIMTTKPCCTKLM